MDARISEYIDLLMDNSIIIKSYSKGALTQSGFYDDDVWNEDLIINTQKISNEELLGYIECYFNDYSHEISHDDFTNIKFQFNDKTYLKDFKLNNCNFKDFQSKLEMGFEEFKQVIADNFIGIDKSFLKETTQELKYSKNQLELFITANKENARHSIDQLMSIKIEFCNETIRFIEYFPFMFPNHSTVKNVIAEVQNNQAEIKNVIAEVLNNQAEIKNVIAEVQNNQAEEKNSITEEQNNQVAVKPKTRRSFEISTNLTHNQVIILFHYLRQLGYIGKEMPKNIYAQHISALTGFSSEKVRQNLSNVDEKSQNPESVLFTEADFSLVRRAMDKLITTIKTDSEKKFS